MLGKFDSSYHTLWKKLVSINANRCVRHIWEAMRHVWPDAHWPGEQHLAAFESRL